MVTMLNDISYCSTNLSRATINALENGRPGDVGIRKLIEVLDLLGYEIRLREKSPFPTFEELRMGHSENSSSASSAST